MNAPDVKGSFGKSAKAALLAAAMATMPFAAANDAQAQRVSGASYVDTSNAAGDSYRWTVGDRDKFAVIVYKGKQCQARKERIGEVLTSDIGEQGLERAGVRVFIEPGKQDQSAVQLVHDGKASVYYDLSDGPNGVRSKIPDFVRKALFDANIHRHALVVGR